jgi:hypothetical protein
LRQVRRLSARLVRNFFLLLCEKRFQVLASFYTLLLELP